MMTVDNDDVAIDDGDAMVSNANIRTSSCHVTPRPYTFKWPQGQTVKATVDFEKAEKFGEALSL